MCTLTGDGGSAAKPSDDEVSLKSSENETDTSSAKTPTIRYESAKNPSSGRGKSKDSWQQRGSFHRRPAARRQRAAPARRLWPEEEAVSGCCKAAVAAG